MYKFPLDYRIDSIHEIMHIPIIIGIGKSSIFKEIKGVIVGYGEVSKSSTLPIFIIVKNSKGKINSYNLFDIKIFRKVG